MEQLLPSTPGATTARDFHPLTLPGDPQEGTRGLSQPRTLRGLLWIHPEGKPGFFQTPMSTPRGFQVIIGDKDSRRRRGSFLLCGLLRDTRRTHRAPIPVPCPAPHLLGPQNPSQTNLEMDRPGMAKPLGPQNSPDPKTPKHLGPQNPSQTSPEIDRPGMAKPSLSQCHRRRLSPSSASPPVTVTGRSLRGCAGQLWGRGELSRSPQRPQNHRPWAPRVLRSTGHGPGGAWQVLAAGSSTFHTTACPRLLLMMGTKARPKDFPAEIPGKQLGRPRARLFTESTKPHAGPWLDTDRD